MTLKRIVNTIQYVTLVAAACTFVLLFAYDPAPTAPAGPDQAGTVDPAGQALFDARCAGCHGAGGSGGFSAPALAGGAVVAAFPDAEDQVQVVTEGRGGMPAFGGDLSTDEITAVVEYTRSL